MAVGVQFCSLICDIFFTFAPNMDRWDGSIEHPQSMFLSQNKKNNVYPVNPTSCYEVPGCLSQGLVEVI